MAAVNESGIVNLPCAAEAIYEGYLYKISSGQATIATTVTDDCVIAVQSSIDDDGAAKTLAANQKMPFYLPHCGKVVKVASLNAMTYTIGAGVYMGPSASTDGLCGSSSGSSATRIGTYYGPNNVATSADGDLIDVLLDTPFGGII